jgi:hypothetical protein
LRQHYLDVALAVRPGIRAGRLGVYVLLGGSLDLLLSANKEDVWGGRWYITGDLHRMDLALLVGAGVALQLPRERLRALHLGTVFLEARHDHGLLETDAVNGGYKNRASSLMLGVSFAVRRSAR